MAKTLDMTKGNPTKLMTAFALPMIAANICQMLYSVADSTVVGRVLGVQAFAAVGAAGFFYWFTIDIVLGLTHGFEVLLAQRFGKKDDLGLRRAIAMSALLTVALSLLLAIASQAALNFVLRVIDTPEDIRELTTLYLRWSLWGLPATAAYNLCSALLRAMGNSRTPLVSVIFSSVTNVLLNLLFAAVFHWGVAGVAAATVLSQLLSCLVCLWTLGKIPEIRLQAGDFRIHVPTVRELLRLGLPPALRNGVISLGGFFIQREINLYGTLFVAGFSASQRYFSLMVLIGSALEGAVATYSGQNYGAGDMDRVKSGMNSARWIALVSSVLSALLIILARKPLISLLVSGSPEDIAAIVKYGSQNLVITVLALPSLYYLCIYRASIQAMGDTLYPTLSGFTELIGRVAGVLLLPKFLGIWGIYMASPLAWVFAHVLLVYGYHSVCRDRCSKLKLY